MVREVENNIKVYDACASEISDFSFPRLPQYQLNQFISNLSKNAKVLDVGCGCGRDVSYLMEEQYDVIGVDLSKGMINEAKKRVEGGNFILMDMLDLKFDKESFDGIWCMASLDHIPKDIVPGVVGKLYDLLSDKGVLYLSVPEGEDEGTVDYEKSGNMSRFCAHYNQEELKALLKAAGFNILTIFTEDDDVSWINVLCKKVTLQ